MKGETMGKNLKGKELGKGFSQRKDGRYNFRYVDRYGRRKNIYNNDLRKLKEEVKIVISKDRLKLTNYGEEMTLNEVFDETVQTYLPNRIKETTIISYIGYYNRYIRNSYLGNKKIGSITVLEIQKFLMSFNKYSDSMIGILRSIFINIYDVVVLYEIKQFNPIYSIKVKSLKEKKIVYPLTQEEQAIFEEISEDSFYNNLYILILNTGLRIGEAIAINKNSDIDFKNNILHINKQLQYHKGKGKFNNNSKHLYTNPKQNSIRDVPLNDIAKQAILNQLELLELIKAKKIPKKYKNNTKYKYHSEFDDLLFLSRSGTPIAISSVNMDLKKICDIMVNKYKLTTPKFGVHVLRHTFATRCYENGMNQKMLSHIMGHKNVSTTNNIYVSCTITGDETEILNHISLYKNNNSNPNEYGVN